MFKNHNHFTSKSNSENNSGSNNGGRGLLPIKLYLAIFTALLIMIFVNVGISFLPIPSIWKLAVILLVAVS